MKFQNLPPPIFGSNVWGEVITPELERPRDPHAFDFMVFTPWAHAGMWKGFLQMIPNIRARILPIGAGRMGFRVTTLVMDVNTLFDQIARDPSIDDEKRQREFDQLEDWMVVTQHCVRPGGRTIVL
jgi:hypothetical protein